MGRELTLAALKRGDKVIATGPARSLPKLDDLASQGADILCLDVTDSLEQLQEAAIKAIAIHGRIDVLVNNAGEWRKASISLPCHLILGQGVYSCRGY